MADDPTAPCRVLIVDDSDDQRELLGKHFTKAGCVIELAESGEDGLAVVLDFAPDIIVLDLLLPGADGWMITTRMRALAPEAAIVISSVLDAHDYPVADAVLPKPFTGDQVRAIAERLRREHPVAD
ncbi:response regulator transcription factor [Leifsonia flava]|uniref:Response regulator n=1 Tax=Orlajensenia leifsoniae TaxID=2561933 RepID=A0A4Y9QVQ0_9MICO|nr:response regulator [Leifsonia flava]TFV95065.1 response regulator [Leifsonia flava]